MGLSRMASKCNICPQRDRCSRKRMEGLGYTHVSLQMVNTCCLYCLPSTVTE